MNVDSTESRHEIRMPTGYKTLTNPPVPDDLPSGQHMFLNSINCESATRHFQPREGPSRGLLRDYEIFANLCLAFGCGCSGCTLCCRAWAWPQLEPLSEMSPHHQPGRGRNPVLISWYINIHNIHRRCLIVPSYS